MNRLLIGSPDKSDLLLEMMVQDFEHGLTLIDPTGQLAPALADRVPVELTEQTTYLDPADVAHPFGLNVLEGVSDDDRHKVAKDICAYFDAMFPEGPTTLSRARSNYALLNCLRVLLDTPNSTFLGITKLLSDSSYRTACIGHCSDPVVLSFWHDEFPKWKAEDLLPLQSKLGELLTSPLIRNILGQSHSTFRFTGNLIVNLDRKEIGDQAAYLLGSLFITRAKGPVYINGLGFFASDHLVSMFSEDRFTVAVDYLDQLPRKLQQAVLSITDKTVFRTTEEDAERLKHYVGVSNPAILTDLDPHEARNRAGVIEPTAPPATGRLEAITRRSRARFTRPRRAVERDITCHFGS